MASKAQRAAVARYDAANTKRYTVKINKNTEADILAHLEEIDNVAGYIKALIREDMKRQHE